MQLVSEIIAGHSRGVITLSGPEPDPTPTGPGAAAERTPAPPVSVLLQEVWGELDAEAFEAVLQNRQLPW